MKKTIIIGPMDEHTAKLLRTAITHLTAKIDNKKHDDLLHRIASNLERPPYTTGELDHMEGFLLQTAARMMAAQTMDASHAAIMHRIALELNTKIHAK